MKSSLSGSLGSFGVTTTVIESEPVGYCTSPLTSGSVLSIFVTSTYTSLLDSSPSVTFAYTLPLSVISTGPSYLCQLSVPFTLYSKKSGSSNCGSTLIVTSTLPLVGPDGFKSKNMFSPGVNVGISTVAPVCEFVVALP